MKAKRQGMYAPAGAAAVLAVLIAGPAHASLIPGLPSVVYDPVNYASAVARYQQLYQQSRGQIRQIEYAYEQARHLRDQARGWRDFRLSDFGNVLRQASRTMGQGISLGYGNPELGEIFRAQFPRVPRIANGMPIPHAEQLNSLRDLAFAAVMSAQMQGQQIDVARSTLDALRRGVVAAATERQLQQAQAAVQTFQAEQDLLMRHTLLSLNQQLAAANAREAQRQMEDEVRASAADGRWRAWEEAVVGDYGDNLSARDRSLAAIRQRAGVRGGAVPGAGPRDPRDLTASMAGRGAAWRYERPAAGGSAGEAVQGGMGGTEAGAGPREWDPGAIQSEPGRIDPWNPEAGGRPVFSQPETGPARGSPASEGTGTGAGGASGRGGSRVAEQQ